MLSYRIALAALALLALFAAPTAAAAQVAVPATAPLTLQDFAGRWWHHGMSLNIKTDGTADMDWRRGGAGVESGAATVRVDRVDGRTLYGIVLTTNYNDGIVVRGPFELTEYDYGVGVLSDARVLGARAIGAPDDQIATQTLCGPRYADAPRWFTSINPCGA